VSASAQQPTQAQIARRRARPHRHYEVSRKYEFNFGKTFVLPFPLSRDYELKFERTFLLRYPLWVYLTNGLSFVLLIVLLVMRLA
jgi:hypothetical protein